MSKITTSLFQEMVQAAATRLNKQAEYVNSLNVFPVPDGDTGTNMGMTIENGAKEVADEASFYSWRGSEHSCQRSFDGCAWKLRRYYVSAFPWIFTSYQG